jgi:NADPH:quinone reductase-like Zn-dependent oxidoreductase
MRAVVHDEYGSPAVLRLAEVPLPSPDAGQVRVKIAATSVNRSDWEGLRGSPLYARLGGQRTRRSARSARTSPGGSTQSGTGVTRFQPGDEVYGDNLAMRGGFAGYAIAPETALARKPAGLTFAEASTIPQAGAIALQGTVSASEGSRVLVNRGGGSGSFAIQQAKRLGAHVTGVDNAGKLDHMRSLGADEVIDYRSDDFTRGHAYDLILDLVAERSAFAYRRALARGGRYRCVRGPVPVLLGIVAFGWIVGTLTDRRIGLLVVKEGRRTSSRSRSYAWLKRSASPSTACSRWKRSPKPSPTSVKAAPSGRSSRPLTRRDAAPRRRRGSRRSGATAPTAGRAQHPSRREPARASTRRSPGRFSGIPRGYPAGDRP